MYLFWIDHKINHTLTREISVIFVLVRFYLKIDQSRIIVNIST